MYVITKFEIPVSEYEFIPMNIKLEVDTNWNDYSGFIAVKYNGSSLYFNSFYFEEVPVIIGV